MILYIMWKVQSKSILNSTCSVMHNPYKHTNGVPNIVYFIYYIRFSISASKKLYEKMKAYRKYQENVQKHAKENAQEVKWIWSNRETYKIWIIISSSEKKSADPASEWIWSFKCWIPTKNSVHGSCCCGIFLAQNSFIYRRRHIMTNMNPYFNPQDSTTIPNSAVIYLSSYRI